MSRRRRKRKRRKKSQRRRSGRRTFRVDLHRIEIARGHDGWLRGDPEPALLVGSYLVDGEGCRLLSRELVRLQVPGPYPAVLEPSLDHVGRGRAAWTHEQRWMLLVLALEQDGSRDIEMLYGAMAEPSRLVAYPSDEIPPDPRGLEELVIPSARSMHVLLDGEDLAHHVRSDDWIGAAAFEHPPSARVADTRVRFLSEDERNDWSIELVTRRRA